MSIACVIPARYQSTRFPAKLLAKARGKTVLQRTFESASACPLFDELFIATDHEEIARHAESFGANVIWTSVSCRNGTERIAEAASNHPALKKATILVNVQGDHPSISKETLSAILEALKSDPSASIATAVCPILGEEISPHRVKCVFDRDKNALYFSRSPIPYGAKQSYLHIGIYAYRREVLFELEKHPSSELQLAEDLEQLKALELGYRIKVAVVSEIPIGIDTPEDLERFESLL